MLRLLALCALLSAGCRHPADSDDTAPIPVDTDDTDEPLGEPLATTDVLVIGSGPTGLSAAWAAESAGREVIVLERSPAAGGSGGFAGSFYAVDTRYQRAAGLVDSVALASEEWAFTAPGGSSDDPRVQQLIERSAEVIEWIDDGLGVAIGPVVPEPGTPGLPRTHRISTGPAGPTAKLVELLEDRIEVGTEATDIVFDDGGVAIGARVRDMATGTEGWIRAGAVVVATGGFARDLDRILEDRPEFTGMELVIEIAYTSDGGGIDLMERAGAAWQNRGAYGMYVHAVGDPREGYAGEALWIPGLQFSVLLDGEGRRFVNEEATYGFGLAQAVAELPGQRAWAVLPSLMYSSTDVIVPPYQGALGSPLELDPQELVDAGVVGVYATPEALAAAQGMDAGVVQATFDAYEASTVSGVDAAFGKAKDGLRPFAGSEYAAFELRVGAAKAFSGFAVDVDGRVLDGAGRVVPGLYAGGEVTGMLGTPAVGIGFSGSATACHLTGLIAGEQAASWTAPP